MDKAEILHLLGWCSLIYLIFLLVWSLILVACHDWMYGLHSKWIVISVEKFNSAHYILLGLFKIIWLMFFLVPYLVLRAG